MYTFALIFNSLHAEDPAISGLRSHVVCVWWGWGWGWGLLYSQLLYAGYSVVNSITPQGTGGGGGVGMVKITVIVTSCYKKGTETLKTEEDRT